MRRADETTPLSAVATVDIVVPTTGRQSLHRLLRSVRDAMHAAPVAHLRLLSVTVVDDRRAGPELSLDGTSLPLRTMRSDGPGLSSWRGGQGPAAARNAGWRAGNAEWVVFLDDDVVVSARWWQDLAVDLALAEPSTAAVQGRIRVPMPQGRKPTDAERNTAGLEHARWITADMAVRRVALEAVGGFDERFRHAYREDSDLALRLQDRGFRLTSGQRTTFHPARAGGWLLSVRQQVGNGDDVRMSRLHGSGWRLRSGAVVGRLPLHLLATGAAIAGLGARVAGRPAPVRLSGPALALWAAVTGDFALRRMVAGPLQPAELGRMLVTSVLIPPVASWHWLRAHAEPAPAPWNPAAPRAVLFDRDGTLIVDVPYNGDPDRVRLMPGAPEAVQRLRSAGLAVAVVSNQSGIARGLLVDAQVQAVNHRVDELLGPLDGWFVCPHGPADRCACRKPAPGLVLQAAGALGVRPDECVVIGDIGADVAAGLSAGARAILVPTEQTDPAEVAACRSRAGTLAEAVGMVLRDAAGASEPQLAGRP